jgi:hypothetical protein
MNTFTYSINLNLTVTVALPNIFPAIATNLHTISFAVVKEKLLATQHQNYLQCLTNGYLLEPLPVFQCILKAIMLWCFPFFYLEMLCYQAAL